MPALALHSRIPVVSRDRLSFLDRQCGSEWQMTQKPTEQRRRRRGKGEGGIRLRSDGRWEATVSRGDGTRKYHYAATRQDAARWLAQAQRAVEQGIVLPDERQTLAAYLDGWLTRIAPTRAPGTVKRHAELVRLYIVPALGRQRLARLTPLHVQTLYSDLLDDGLSPATVNRVHAVLHKALEDAMRLDLIPRNVADRVTAPRAQRKEMHVLSQAQVRTFLDALDGERLEALYVLAVTSGMRLGELLGVQWADIDLSCGWLQVQRNLQQDRETGALYLRQPKTASSRRQVALTPQAVDALRSHRNRQRLERLRAGSAWRDRGLVFCNEIGEPVRPAAVYRRFLHILARSDLPRIRFHDLRHTCATLMLQAGVNAKVASGLLGHATVGMTLDTYSHVTDSMQQDAATALAKVLAR